MWGVIILSQLLAADFGFLTQPEKEQILQPHPVFLSVLQAMASEPLKDSPPHLAYP